MEKMRPMEVALRLSTPGREARLRVVLAAPVLLLGLALASSGRLCAQEPDVAPSPLERKVKFGTRINLKGVPNFGKVTETLYRGAQPTDEGFTNLSKLGISIVVDLRGSGPHERELVTKLGMKYVAYPWHCYNPQDEQFAQFLTLLRENPGQKVFVHCRLGEDRTGMEIAAFRMAEQSWTPDQARQEMILFGANWFHRAICPELGPYAKQFPERFKNNAVFEKLRTKQSRTALDPVK